LIPQPKQVMKIKTKGVKRRKGWRCEWRRGKTLLLSKPQRYVWTAAKQLVLRFIYRKEAGAFVIRVFIFVFDDPVPVLWFLSFRGSIPSSALMMVSIVLRPGLIQDLSFEFWQNWPGQFLKKKLKWHRFSKKKINEFATRSCQVNSPT
jgi:hypothetical protein